MKYKIKLIGLLIMSVSIVIGFVFRNPYPCSISGIGCSSIWEMFSDTWSDWISFIGVILGSWLIMSEGIYNFMNKKQKR